MKPSQQTGAAPRLARSLRPPAEPTNYWLTNYGRLVPTGRRLMDGERYSTNRHQLGLFPRLS